jgi:hypothetical protein
MGNRPESLIRNVEEQEQAEVLSGTFTSYASFIIA